MIRILLFLLLLCALPPAHADKAALNAALVKAIDFNNLTRARSLIVQGADVNARNDIGQTVLERASQYGNYECAKALIDLGADVNSTSNYGGPLVMAVAGGYGNSSLAVCRLLLDSGANPNGHLGAESPLLSVLSTAVGMEEQPTNIIGLAVSTTDHSPAGQRQVIEVAKTEQKRLRTAFIKIERDRVMKVRKTGLEIVCLLILRGADVNLALQDGTSPLMAATRAGSMEAVRLLLSHGARSDARTADRQNLLMFASASVELSRLYLERGNNVNARDDRGYTALIMATMGQHPDVVKLFVEHGADVNARNIFGEVPLTNAETWEDLASVEYLLNHGADTHIKDKHGNTPLGLAREYKNPALVSLLIRAGAKE